MLASVCVCVLHGVTAVVSRLVLACVVRQRACHSLPIPVLADTRACSMVHATPFDIASLVLDGCSRGLKLLTKQC